MFDTVAAPDRAILVQPLPDGEDPERVGRLAEELGHLAASAGLEVVDGLTVAVHRITPNTYLGPGAVERVRELVTQHEAQVVVCNASLSPVQQRNLERALMAKVVDRTGLILEIFAARARTREGRLQVALASLLYQQSRLVRSWTHLERQRGGVGLRGGPGERQLEIDRRMIRDRVHQLKKELTLVERTRALQRQARQDVPLPAVALVGYTNAGKSTLFNLLAGASVEAADQLFATLDPTVRAVRLPGGGRVVLSDTVGFIRDLPHQLVASFRATLEEVLEAELLIHVVDLSDPEWEEQIEAVMVVLRELGADDKPMLMACNKLDALPPEREGLVQRLSGRADTVVLSARTGEGIERLLNAMELRLFRDWHTSRLHLPMTEGALLARLHREGRILEQREEGEDYHLTVALPPQSAGRLRHELEKFQPPT